MLLLLLLLPLLAALPVYAAGKQKRTRLRDGILLAVLIFEALAAAWLAVVTLKGGGETVELPAVCGIGLSFITDGFRVIYALLAILMWLVSGLFLSPYFGEKAARPRFDFFFLLTLSGVLGVFFAADFFTLLLFFELMTFTSYPWVAQEESRPALRAAATYLAIALIGGLFMLMGLFLLQDKLGTLELAVLAERCAQLRAEGVPLFIAETGAYLTKERLFAAGLLLLVGFGAKAGMYPLHIWLPKAHPVAPAPASALLSGMLTKTGIFGILLLCTRMFVADTTWSSILLACGVVTMLWGALLALNSVDLKRTLACSSVSQIGFILVGAGLQGFLCAAGFAETGGHLAEGAVAGLAGASGLLTECGVVVQSAAASIAVRGTLLHMLNHSLFKLVLFLVAAVIYMRFHTLDLNRLRGAGRKQPLLLFWYVCGAAGIAGVPLFSGYISKTLLHEGLVEYCTLLREAGRASEATLFRGIELLFLFAGGLTVAYMLKLFVILFVAQPDVAKQQGGVKLAKRQGEAVHTHSGMLPLSCRLALTAAAVLIFLFGAFPTITMEPIAAWLSEGFPVGEAAHAVHYFSLEALKGAGSSIVIGLLLYVVVVRGRLLKREADGGLRVRTFTDWRVPDLEDTLYRPLLLKALPFLLAIPCRLMDKTADGVAALFVAVGTRLSRLLDTMTDRVTRILLVIGQVLARCMDTAVMALCYVLRRTVYRELTEKPKPVGTAMTRTLGTICNLFSRRRQAEEAMDYRWIFAQRRELRSKRSRVLESSMSYGLLLFCVGLCLTLLYLLFSVML